MPTSIFTPECESRLLEIWRELLEATDKDTAMRSSKEVKATAKLNAYTKEIGLDWEFTVVQVSNKIDSLKKRKANVRAIQEDDGIRKRTSF